MKRIVTNGITNLEPLQGSNEWYWGADYASGDLYEAEELFRSGHPVQKNRLLLVHRPEGTVYEPIRTKPGQYLGKPVCHKGQIVLLLVDFPEGEIRILTFHEADGTTEPLAVLPLTMVEDCYNLMLEASPLLMTRSAHDNQFQIIWPERRDFAIEDHEMFAFLEGNRLYTWVWYEDPDYREEVLVRDFNTRDVLERIPGNLRTMPDGQNWLLV
jgi:hypothetical protein